MYCALVCWRIEIQQNEFKTKVARVVVKCNCCKSALRSESSDGRLEHAGIMCTVAVEVSHTAKGKGNYVPAVQVERPVRGVVLQRCMGSMGMTGIAQSIWPFIDKIDHLTKLIS
jgi:hypothetical protein